MSTTTITIEIETCMGGDVPAVQATARVDSADVAWAREMNASTAVHSCMQEARAAVKGPIVWHLPFCGRTFDVAWWEKPERKPNLREIARVRRRAHREPVPAPAEREGGGSR